MLSKLLERRVVFVLGKGGVGRSTVAATLAVAAASRGRKVCLAEVNGSESMAAIFDRPPVGYAGAQIAPNIEAMSITPQQSVEEYLVRTLRFRVLYDLVFRNRAIEPFMNAVMGLSDLMTIGKVLDLEWLRADGTLGTDARGPYRWDLIVVDCPATGHGQSLLAAPQAMMDVTRVGPLHQNARLVRDLVSDRRRTAAIVVTLPEELPVQETLEGAARLRTACDVDLVGAVVNAMPPAPFQDQASAARWPEVRAAALRGGPLGSELVASVERARIERSRAEGWAETVWAALQIPTFHLPRLPMRDLDAAAIERLAASWDQAS